MAECMQIGQWRGGPRGNSLTERTMQKREREIKQLQRDLRRKGVALAETAPYWL